MFNHAIRALKEVIKEEDNLLRELLKDFADHKVQILEAQEMMKEYESAIDVLEQFNPPEVDK